MSDPRFILLINISWQNMVQGKYDVIIFSSAHVSITVYDLRNQVKLVVVRQKIFLEKDLKEEGPGIRSSYRAIHLW